MAERPIPDFSWPRTALSKMLTEYRRSPEVIEMAEAGKTSMEIAEATGKGSAVVTDILWRAGYRWRWKMFGRVRSRRQRFREQARIRILNQAGRWKTKARLLAASLGRAGHRKAFRLNILKRWFKSKRVRKTWVKFYDWPSPVPLDFRRGAFEVVRRILEKQNPKAFWEWRWTWVLPDDPQRAAFALALWSDHGVLLDEEGWRQLTFDTLIHGREQDIDSFESIWRRARIQRHEHPRGGTNKKWQVCQQTARSLNRHTGLPDSWG